MNKMQKLTLARIFKIIFYLLGFPLLLLFVAKDSMIYFNQDMFSETAKNGITAVFLLWIGFAFLQLGLYLVMKKRQALRTIILIVLAMVLMLAPIATMDKTFENKLEKVQTKYADKGVKLNDYNLQQQWFNTLSDKDGYTDKLIETADKIERVYGLSEFYPKIYRTRTQVNTPAYIVVDGKKVSVDGQPADKYFDKHLTEKPYAYNPNGLLYDGYVFGVETAVEQLIEYHEFEAKQVYRKINYADCVAGTKYYIIDTDGKYVEATASTDPSIQRYELLTLNDAYNKLVAEQLSATSGAWYDYTQSDDYKKYKAEQDQYVITPARLNEILSTLFEYIGQSDGLNNLISGLNLDSILNLVSGLLKPDESDLTGGAIGTVVTQLLYGYNNGTGGSTTGLALPAQYLFNNIKFSESTTLKTLYGTLTEDGLNVQLVDGSTIPVANADNYYVFVMKYIDNAENPEEPILKLSYEKYGTVKGTIKVQDNPDPAQLNQTFFNGQFYTAKPITTEYEAYKTNLETNYPTTPATAALVDLIKSLQPALGLVGGLLNGDAVMGMVGGLVPGLDVGAILNAILKPGALDKVINALLGGIDLTGITVEGMQSLLDGILSEVSFYYHPMLNVCWQQQFLSEDDKALVATDGSTVDLSEYATNKYNCEQFGITAGCVLIAKGGLLTGTTIGNGSNPAEGLDLATLYQFQAELEYAKETYPLLSARRYMAIWPGILAMSIFFVAYFYQKEQKYFYEITKNGGEY